MSSPRVMMKLEYSEPQTPEAIHPIKDISYFEMRERAPSPNLNITMQSLEAINAESPYPTEGVLPLHSESPPTPTERALLLNQAPNQALNQESCSQILNMDDNHLDDGIKTYNETLAMIEIHASKQHEQIAVDTAILVQQIEYQRSQCHLQLEANRNMRLAQVYHEFSLWVQQMKNATTNENNV